MTLQELKKAADELGYRVVKKNDYTCACCGEYPLNDKCERTHEFVRKSKSGHFTYCKKRGT
jgi:hypothetical protein